MAIFKENEYFSSNQRKQEKEIEHFIQSLQVLENPQLLALFRIAFSANTKNLID